MFGAQRDTSGFHRGNSCSKCGYRSVDYLFLVKTSNSSTPASIIRLCVATDGFLGEMVKKTATGKTFRILSLDGGGAKGFYTLGVLAEVEAATCCSLMRMRSRPSAAGAI